MMPRIAKGFKVACPLYPLRIIKEANDFAPNLTNRFILDTSNSLKIIAGGEIVNEILNESSPIPLSPLGTILSGMKNTDSLLNDKEKINDIKNIFISNDTNGNK